MIDHSCSFLQDFKTYKHGFCCELCKKTFSQKSNYEKHLKRKTPCKKNIITNNIINNTNNTIINNNIEVQEQDTEIKLKTKHKLGQFYTTNYEYILQNLNIPSSITNIIEPFAGNGDLLNFINKENIDENIDENTNKYFIESYDIDPKNANIIQRDTILNPPDYNNKFIITNPPYLARNKSDNKIIFDKYQQNDLYKCFLIELTQNKCLGGIIIIPLNFWCSIRKNDIELRQKFINVYDILIMNIFEERVFDDTSYTVCSFQFQLKNNTDNIINITNTAKTTNNIKCFIYPSKLEINFELNKNNNYTIGGEIYNLKQNSKTKIERLTKNNKNSEFKTNILLKCIDDSIDNKICLSIVKDENIYIDTTPNLSARSYASFTIEPKISSEDEEKLVNNFNLFLNEKRNKYNSLFLTNFRESNSIARKRISFGLAFEIINYLLE
jgi:hypothetical protein